MNRPDDPLRSRPPSPAPERAEAYRVAVEESLQGVILIQDQRVVFVNPAAERLTGYSREELVSFSPEQVRDMIVPGDREGAWRRLEQRPEGPEAPFRTEVRFHRKDGEVRWLEVVATRATYGGRPAGLFTVLDVTERKQAERALRESEARFAKAFLASPTAALVASLDDGRVIDVNESLERTTGYRRADVVGRLAPELGLFAGPAQVLAMLETLRAGGSVRAVETPYTNAAGEPRVALLFAEAIGLGGERCAIWQGIDVTESKRAEDALRASEARFRLVTEGAREYVAEIDEGGRFVYVSGTVEGQLGYEPGELVGRTADEAYLALVHPEDRADVETGLAGALAGEEVRSGPYRLRDRAGHWHWLETVARTIHTPEGRRHLVSVSRDVTERVQAEEARRRLGEQVMRARRLEGLGVLAGGVAHDFNNLLVAIRGNAELALLRLAPRHPVRPLLEDLDRAAERAAELTRSLLTYAGKGWAEMEPVDLADLVRGTLRILRGGMPARTRTELPAEGSGPWVAADATQLGQVVMNLLTNATEALEGGEGEVRVRVGAERLDRAALASCLLAEGVEPGEYAFLEVSDTGCGMDPETLERIFDPFYTTKFQGRGLGLAGVLGVVRRHGGTLRVTSAPERGTRFQVFLPRAPAGTADRPAGARQSAVPGARGAVLVVDDEPAVGAVASRMLEACGFTVEVVGSGAEALERVCRAPQDVDAVLLDLTMPEMGGEETFTALRRVRADLPVVFMSGHSEEDVARRLEGRALVRHVAKPFRLDTLAERLRDVLEELEKRDG